LPIQQIYAFARLGSNTHRDMGPKVRYLGEVPAEELIWQILFLLLTTLIDEQDAAQLKQGFLLRGTVSELVKHCLGFGHLRTDLTNVVVRTALVYV
jgi:catalase (peroxidase I)